MELVKVQFHFQLLDIMPFYLQAFRTLFYLELRMTTNLVTNDYDSQQSATGHVWQKPAGAIQIYDVTL